MTTPIPADLSYSADHEWVDRRLDAARVGITAHAADALGDVVFVDLPSAGSAVVAGEPCGEIESTKSVSDIYAPLTGTVFSVNEAVEETPGLINSEPYGSGWLFEISVAADAELLTPTQYAELTGGFVVGSPGASA